METVAILGFILAGYSVIANDSLQTLGTWINSNKSVKWYYQWAFASIILVGVIFYGHYTGDVSYGRLDKIPYQPIQWYHALAPLTLLILTRLGIPVSTSFLVLSVFASSFVMEKMLVKSFLGYGVAAITAYLIWLGISQLMKKREGHNSRHSILWRIAQWASTGFLWVQWLQHDHANIAIFLPREHSLLLTSLVVLFYVGVLGWVFKERGGSIQKVVANKSNMEFVRSATVIDLIYAFILYFFKELNNIPMSTTFVFVGLLAGRELAIHSIMLGKSKLRETLPSIGKDFLKLLIGVSVSITVVLLVNYVIK